MQQVEIGSETRESVARRLRVEKSRQETEELFFKAFNISAQPMSINAISDGRFIEVNESFLLTTGYSRAEVMGCTADDLDLWEDPEHRSNSLELLTGQGSARNLQIGFRMKTGEVRLVNLSTDMVVIDGEQGILAAVEGTARPNDLERALEQIEDRYRTIIDSLDDGYWETDLAGNYTFANRSAARSFRRSGEELLGLNNKELMDEADVKRLDSAFEKVYLTGEPATGLIFEQTRGDGPSYCVETNVSLIRDSEGKPIGFRGVSREITKRKRAEEALRESEEKYRTILESIEHGYQEEEKLRKSEEQYRAIIDNMEDGYWEVGLSGEFTFVNDSALALHGRSREEMLGLHPRQYMDEETAKRVADKFNEIYKTGEPAKGFSLDIIKSDGTRRTHEATMSLMRDPEGKPIGFRGLSRDITERKQAEESLRQSEERYRTIIEDMNDGYSEQDLAGRFTFLNKRSVEGQRRSREELMGSSNKLFMDEETAKRVGQAYKQIYRTGEPVKGLTYEIIRGDGTTYYVESSVSLIKDSEGKPTGFRTLARDITTRKEAELELQRAKEAAEATSRAKSEFLANMSHEIRTPMNGIIGMTELALDTELTSEQREYLGMVNSSADALLTIVNDILDFSKIEAGKLDLDLSAFNLRDNLDDTLRSLALRTHQKGLELIYYVLPEVPEGLVGDPGRLRQIIVNLIGNAIKFTAAGEIMLRIEIESQTEEEIFLLFTVSDTGIGIPEDKQHLIFEAFSQADGSTTRKYGGTGLGLTISSRLVEIMGGRIWVGSTLGQGSVFHFTARFGKQPESEIQPVRTPTAKLQNLPVLIVDDNAINRRILVEMLTHWHMRPTAVDGGQSALVAMEQARVAQEPFPLVLLDCHMPKMDGFSLAEHIKQRPELTGATIMMLTSGGQQDDIARCKKLGIAAYLTKPIKQSLLLHSMVEVLSGLFQEDAQAPLVTRQLVAENHAGFYILLAEDNIINQTLTVRLLEKRGHKVVVANNGLEAVAAVRLERFDLVLMDVQMPEMNGFDATAAIREHEKERGTHIPIIAMTAHAMKGDRERCLEAGMDGYVAKPIQFKELLAVIGEVIKPPELNETPLGESGANEVMDLAVSLNRVDGDMELLVDLAKLFLDDCPRMLSDIRGAISSSDRRALERTARTLKGTVRNFAAKAVFNLALRLEMMGREGDFISAEEAYTALETETENLKPALVVIGKQYSF